MDRRYRYLRHKDSQRGLLFFSSLDRFNYSAEEMFQDPNVDVVGSVIAKLMGERVRDCLLELSENERMLIWLLFFDGESEVKLAKRMGIPRTTLQSRKYVALEKLKELIENH